MDDVLVLLSDTHCGSRRSVLPPGLCNEDGAEMVPILPQLWLNARWDEAVRFVLDKAGGDFGLVLLGDMIEGVHHGGAQVVSSDTAIHCAIAEHMLSPLTEAARKVWMVRGTETHTGRSAEAGLALAFGAEKNRDENTYTFDRLNLCINGCRITAAHHFPTSTRIGLYATQLSVQLAEAQTQAARSKHPIPEVVVGAHRHTGGMYTDWRGMCLTLPPWQLLTRFGYKVVPYATPTVGLVILDWRGLPKGSLPRVIPWLRSGDLPTCFGSEISSSSTTASSPVARSAKPSPLPSKTGAGARRR